MAIVTANGADNTSVANIFKSYLLQATNLTPTSFVLFTGNVTVTVTGNGFAYDPNLGLTAGTITGLTETFSGSPVNQTWTGLNVSGPTEVQTLLTGNLDNSTALFFTGDDTFNVTLPSVHQELMFKGYGGNDTFNFSGGANSFSVDGGDGNDIFNFNAYTGVILAIIGGNGIDTANFNAGYGNQQSPFGDGSGNINISNVENIHLGAGHNYSFLAPTSIATAGQTVTVDGSALGASDTLTFMTYRGPGNTLAIQGNLVLTGGAGNDTLQGALGNDTFNGGGGIDTVSYDFGNFGSGVTVNLNLTTAQAVGTGWGNDTFNSIENLIGTAFDDTLTGNAGDNILNGGSGGNDVLDGGAGNDTASYANLSGYVNISLAVSGPQSTGFSQQTLISIENLIGTNSDDVIEGNSGDNVLNGGGGINTVSYAHATSGVTVDFRQTGPQAVGGGMGNDTLINFQKIIGSDYNDTFIASTNAYTYPDQSSADLFNGGAGFDTVDFSHVSGPVSFGIPTGPSSPSIEHVIGSNYDDVITAYIDGSILDGGNGNDTLSNLYPGSGTFQMLGGAGNDTIKVYALVPTDFIDGGTGIDTVSIPATGGYLSATFSPTTMTNVEILNLDEANYQLITNDATVAAGATLTVQFPTHSDAYDLGLSLQFDGSAETDGSFIINSFGGHDTLTGGAGNDTIDGGAGNDTIDGGAGYDTASYASALSGVTVDLSITGPQDTIGAGTDTLTNIEYLVGSNFNDALSGDGVHGTHLAGGAGDDTLQSGAGDDYLDGGAGNDFASYANAAAAVNVDLSVVGAQNTGAAGNDQLVNIEGLIGSAFSDTLKGDGVHPVTIYAGGGNDFLQGGPGNDYLDGGAGYDAASYVNATAGVNVDLTNSGPQNTGGAGVDTLVNIEYLIGSSFDDVLKSNGTDNIYLAGGAGNDVLQAGPGNDYIDGGPGYDVTSYGNATSAVNVDLSIQGDQNTGGGGIDTLISIEYLFGSSFNDTLKGDGVHNIYLSGGAGNDTLQGGAGDDYLDGGAGYDTASYANAAAGVNVDLTNTAPQNTGGAGIDQLVNIEYLIGSNFNDTLKSNGTDNIYLAGGAGNDVLQAGPGNDYIDGGPGYDVTSYGNATSAVNVDLSIVGDQNTGGGGIDTLISIEYLFGSPFDDTLKGDGVDNIYLSGGAGNDTLQGGAGDDYLVDGTGSDTLTGGSGSDVFAFTKGDGLDVITDFSPGNGSGDTIDLTGYGILNFGALTPLMSQAGADTVIAFDAQNHITLHNVIMGQLNAGDFLFH